MTRTGVAWDVAGKVERVDWKRGLPISYGGGPAMRLPRPRLTIRWMMVLVAVAALALSVEATRRRMADLSLAYLGRAREYSNKGNPGTRQPERR